MENRYTYLVKSRAKALSVFEKVKKNLDALTAQIDSEVQACLARQDAIAAQKLRLDAELEQEKQAVGYLLGEKESTINTASKIGTLLG